MQLSIQTSIQTAFASSRDDIIQRVADKLEDRITGLERSCETRFNELESRVARAETAAASDQHKLMERRVVELIHELTPPRQASAGAPGAGVSAPSSSATSATGSMEYTRRVVVRGWEMPYRKEAIIDGLTEILREAQVSFLEVQVRGIRAEKASVLFQSRDEVWPAISKLRELGLLWKGKALRWSKDSDARSKIVNGKLWACKEFFGEKGITAEIDWYARSLYEAKEEPCQILGFTREGVLHVCSKYRTHEAALLSRLQRPWG
eukprot:4507606-Amphidinium_carterae.1